MFAKRQTIRFACCALVAIVLGFVVASARADESLFVQPQTSQATPAANPVRQVNHSEPSRLLSPESEASLPLPGAPHGDSQKASSGPHTLEALFSVAASLAAVLGLFFVIAWVMRRGLPSSAANRLPSEVVDVLGRAPLAGRQQMQLLRLGSKLLLVCVSANGVNTLGEVTDPAEVERLAALCRSNKSAGASLIAKNLRRKFEAAGEAGDA